MYFFNLSYYHSFVLDLPSHNLLCALDDSYGLAALYIGQALQFEPDEMEAIRYHPSQVKCSAAFLLYRLSRDDCSINELRHAAAHLGNEVAVKILDDKLEKRIAEMSQDRSMDHVDNIDPVFNLQDLSDELHELSRHTQDPPYVLQGPPVYLKNLRVGELMALCEPLSTAGPECDWKAVAKQLRKGHIIREIEAPKNSRSNKRRRSTLRLGGGEQFSGAYNFIDILSIRYETIVSLRDEIRDYCTEHCLNDFPEIKNIMEAFQQCFDAKVKMRLSNCEPPNGLAFLTPGS